MIDIDDKLFLECKAFLAGQSEHRLLWGAKIIRRAQAAFAFFPVDYRQTAALSQNPFRLFDYRQFLVILKKDVLEQNEISGIIGQKSAADDLEVRPHELDIVEPGHDCPGTGRLKGAVEDVYGRDHPALAHGLGHFHAEIAGTGTEISYPHPRLKLELTDDVGNIENLV